MDDPFKEWMSQRKERERERERIIKRRIRRRDQTRSPLLSAEYLTKPVILCPEGGTKEILDEEEGVRGEGVSDPLEFC